MNKTRHDFLAAIATSYIVVVADFCRTGNLHGPIAILAIVFLVFSVLGFLIA